ncbi:MAG: ABC transporter substrate-binding protein [Oscillospiraceae bacterium]|nr:ABC transporter substrate-binding protein [Oscillospiraceae bacterium]MBR3949588.1 ABC transporter substrate-binding protein [Oscillospiraceae bacterium]
MKKFRKIFALVLALMMALSVTACGAKEAPAETTAAAAAPETTAAPVIETEEAPVAETTQAMEEEGDESDPVSIMVLNGTTGFGMANLMDAAAKGETYHHYNFVVETDASNIVAGLVNGSVDIAALPTNAAATVYNKTQGNVQVLALNTLGVLYLVTDGSVTINSMADLAGKTVYAPAQNPTFIFQHLVQANGLSDVTIDNTYAQPADLNTAVAAGQVSIAVLPEPMVTVAKSKNPDLVVALDLTQEWDKVSPAGSLVQGCVVVRTDFVMQNTAVVNDFLMEYGASIEAMTADVEGTAAKIEANGIFTKAAVAAKAIPNCNVCFITGEQMQEALSEFLTIMHGVAPASVGGSIPGDDFYCIFNG